MSEYAGTCPAGTTVTRCYEGVCGVVTGTVVPREVRTLTVSRSSLRQTPGQVAHEGLADPRRRPSATGVGGRRRTRPRWPAAALALRRLGRQCEPGDEREPRHTRQGWPHVDRASVEGGETSPIMAT